METDKQMEKDKEINRMGGLKILDWMLTVFILLLAILLYKVSWGLSLILVVIVLIRLVRKYYQA